MLIFGFADVGSPYPFDEAEMKKFDRLYQEKVGIISKYRDNSYYVAGLAFLIASFMMVFRGVPLQQNAVDFDGERHDVVSSPIRRVRYIRRYSDCYNRSVVW